MNIPTEFSFNLTPPPHPDLGIFPFMEKRYKSGFFTQFVNSYFLLLLEDSSRLKWDAADNFDKHLDMIFNPKLVDTKCFSRYYLQCFIYEGPQSLHESGEITSLSSPERFLLSSKYTLLNQLKLDDEEIKHELLRQAGLLLIHSGRDSLKTTEPRFIVITRRGVNFCDIRIIKDSLLKYKAACSNAVTRMDRVAPFGRTYAPIASEYFEFIDFILKRLCTLLTQDLKDVLNKWHQHYKKGDISPKQKIGDGIQTATGPLHYLQGRPSGSAPKK